MRPHVQVIRAAVSRHQKLQNNEAHEDNEMKSVMQKVGLTLWKGPAQKGWADSVEGPSTTDKVQTALSPGIALGMTLFSRMCNS